MIEKLLSTIERFDLINKGDTVTVALSGGADSVSLLHLLLSVKDRLGITLNAAHLNHMIRGNEAERDAQFVKELCEKLGVKLFYEEVDVPSLSKEKGISLELAARQARYDFFERVASSKVATAHTASDNLETMIFNLARGTSLKGLCGIPVKRGIYIRPLILFTRQDVETYCEKNDLSFVTDSTNLSDDYSRNKIRHNIIPVLKELNFSCEETALRTAQGLTEDSFYLEDMAQGLLFKYSDDDGLSISDFENIAPCIAKRIIKQFIEIIYPAVSLDNRHINSIYSLCLKGSGKLNIPSNLYASVCDGVLRLQGEEAENTVQFAVKITEKENVNNLFSINAIDCDKIVGKWILRTRREGDSIRLYKRGVTKTLKKLFTEDKIPNEIRSEIPVIADENGVIWVYGFGVCERVAVNKNTKNILKVEVQEL